MVGKIQRGDLFLHLSEYGECYRMVVSTSVDGLSFISFTSNEESYKNISDIFIEDIGYANIDRIIFIRWSKFINMDMKKTARIEGAAYTNIINAVFKFMSGDIYMDNDGILDYDYYSETESIFSQETDIAEAHKVSDLIIGTNPDDDYDDYEKEYHECEEKEAVPVEDGEYEGLNERYDYEDMSKDASKVKMIDILEYRGPDKIPTGYNIDRPPADPNARTRYDKKRKKHIWVHEKDVIRIALSNTTAIMKEFDVNRNTASYIIRNCRRIENMEDKTHEEFYSFYPLFDDGYTVEEVVKSTGAPPSYVKASYEKWKIDRSVDPSNNDVVVNKWDRIIADGDFATIYKYSNMTINEFAKEEQCSRSIAYTLYSRIKYKLCKNIYYLMRMNDSECKFNVSNAIDYINRVRSATYKDEDIYDAVQYCVNTVESLRNIYLETYDDHNDFLVGSKPIPDEVSDKDAFITMISNRFHYKQMIVKDRTYTTFQKHLLKNGGTVSEFIAGFLIMDIEAAKKIRNNARRHIGKSW